MNFNNIFKILLILTIVLIGFYQLWLGLIEQFAFIDNKTEKKYFSEYQRDPELLSKWAHQEHLYEGNIKISKELYVKAIESNPLYMPAWIGLSELLNDTGETKKAVEILYYVDSITRDIQKWRWSKTLLAYQLGLYDMVENDLRYIVFNMPVRRNQALNIAYDLWQDPLKILEKIGERNIIYLYEYFNGKQMIDANLVLWNKIKELNLASKDIIIDFTNILILKKKVEEAKKIWYQYYSSDNKIYNNDFEYEPLNKSFGWRIIKNDDVSVNIIPVKTSEGIYEHCMKVLFMAQSNILFQNIRQIIPVEPLNTYCFDAQIKTEDIQTDKRPYFQFTGFECKGLLIKSPMFEKDSDWHNISLKFDVPEGCHALNLFVIRDKSLNFDNKIKGTLFMDKLSLRECHEVHD